MMQELFAKKGGLCGGKGGSMHIADLDRGMLGANGIVGGGPPLVVGAALTAKTLGRGTVAVSFTGDGGSNQGTTFEAMNMAVVLKLPAIFVFENNQYGEGTGVGYAVGSHDIAGRAAGFGLPAALAPAADRARSKSTLADFTATTRAMLSSIAAKTRSGACARTATA
jgi:pyruvate dehydrogenase E1 component alpha subunit